MLPGLNLPVSWSNTLQAGRPALRAPSSRMFQVLATGLVAQVGRKSVVGMLSGSAMVGRISFQAACRFFSDGAWQVDALSVAVARLIVDRLVPDGAPILVVVDDTLVKRWGRKVFAALWTHDGSAQGGGSSARGNRWVVAGIVVDLPFLSHPVCLPVMFRLWLGKNTASHNVLAAQMLDVLCHAFPDRQVHGVGDAAYHGRDLLVGDITFTTRLPRNAVLHGYAPAPTGRRGRPRTKGERPGTAAQIAAHPATIWRDVTVIRYGRTGHLLVADTPALWYGAFGPARGRAVLLRDPARPDQLLELALLTTDLHAPAEMIAERYARRWSIEPANAIGKQIMGVGQARNRVPRAVRRTVPFAFLVQSLVIVWYAEHGHDPADITARREREPWYTSKEEPSFEDMIAKLRRVLIYSRFSSLRAGQASPPEIHDYALACTLTAA